MKTPLPRAETTLKMKAAVAAGLAALMLVLAGCSDEGGDPNSRQTAPRTPPQAGFISVKAEAVTLSANVAGRVVAYQTAEIRPQIGGIIEQRVFKEGSEVKRGDVLYRIDDESYRASVASAQASLEKAQAALVSAQAKNDRFKALGDGRAVSQQDLDDAQAAFLQAKADVSVAKASLDSAQINLNYATIRAPIDGQIGTSSVTAGSLVTASQAEELATIRQLDPVYVDLTESSGNLIKFRNDIREGRLSPLIGSGKSPEVRLTFADGSPYDEQGTIESAEQFVDETTSSFVIRTLFKNDDRSLLPGMYVHATISLANNDKGFLLPQRAISRDNKGLATARFITQDGTVESRTLNVITDLGTRWLVTEGVADGDRLVVDGIQNIQDGQKVTPVEVRLDDNGIVQPLDKAAANAQPATAAAKTDAE